MVENKKSRSRKTKERIKITVKRLEPFHLTNKQRKALNQALKSAGETFVESPNILQTMKRSID